MAAQSIIYIKFKKRIVLSFSILSAFNPLHFSHDMEAQNVFYKICILGQTLGVESLTLFLTREGIYASPQRKFRIGSKFSSGIL